SRQPDQPSWPADAARCGPTVASTPWCSSALLLSGRALVRYRENTVWSWLTCPPPAQPTRTGGLLRRSGSSRARCTSSIVSGGRARRDTKVLSKVLFRVVWGTTGVGGLRGRSLRAHKHAIDFTSSLVAQEGVVRLRHYQLDD